MKNYLIICVISITFFSLLENMLIKGKLNKMVKSVFSIICILIIASPITNLIKGEYNLNVVNFNEDLTNHLVKIEENTAQIEIKNMLIKNNFNVSNVSVTAINDGGIIKIEKILVILKSQVINESGEHIILIKQAEDLLKKNCYNCILEVYVEE